jgi:hypothetical protein
MSACATDADCAGAFCDPVTKKCQVNGPGCRTGARVGFKDAVVWPNIASCGQSVGFVQAFAESAQTCDDGWHGCTIQDVNGYTNTTGPTDDGGWIKYDDPNTKTFVESPNLLCGGQVAISNLAGTGACNTTATFPQGFRLVVLPSTWGRSHFTSAGCVLHAAHDCGVAGGAFPIHPHPTLCCR